MSTKRFAWKDRDTAAQDLMQLVYHAPPSLSQQTLYLLGAIRSNAIVPDLREIVLDSDRGYWDRTYALRALGNVPGNIYFPELASLVNEHFGNRQQVIAQHLKENEDLDELYIPDDLITEIVVFVANHPINEKWLFNRFDQADPQVLCISLTEQLSFLMPQAMSVRLSHRLIDLLEVNPTLLTLDTVSQLYDYGVGDTKVQNFLQEHFDAIVEKSVSAKSSKYSHSELPWTLPLEWPELKAAIFRLRPEFEERFLRDEARRAIERNKHESTWREDLSYRETVIWQELEALYERANANSTQDFWTLYHKTFDDRLSSPVRAAATHFFGKLRDRPGAIAKLAFLARSAHDDWEQFSPVRFEAAKALFDAATPQAWEGLVEALLAASNNLLMSSLRDWIESLTDMLSGIATTFQDHDYAMETRWRTALFHES